LIAGIAMSVVGILILLAPGLSLIAATRFLGFFWLIDGVIRLVSLFVDRSGWGWKLLSGVLGIAAGLLIIEHPLWSALLIPTMFVFYIAALGIALGVVELVMAFRGAGWGTGILGVVSILFGVLVMFNPLAGVLTVPLMLGALALGGGVATAISSFTTRSSGA
jgi:uncharacterized membrane protein HdeD (DUF308 family)